MTKAINGASSRRSLSHSTSCHVDLFSTQFGLTKAPLALHRPQEYAGAYQQRIAMGNTTSGKMVKEIVCDAKAILQARNKGSIEQIVTRQEDIQRQLLEVSKHKEQLLKRRAAGVRSIVKEYEAKRADMLNNFASRQQQHQQHQQPSPFDTPSDGTAPTAGSNKSGPILLPSPDEVLKRVRSLSERASDGGSSSSSSSSSSSPGF